MLGASIGVHAPFHLQVIVHGRHVGPFQLREIVEGYRGQHGWLEIGQAAGYLLNDPVLRDGFGPIARNGEMDRLRDRCHVFDCATFAQRANGQRPELGRSYGADLLAEATERPCLDEADEVIHPAAESARSTLIFLDRVCRELLHLPSTGKRTHDVFGAFDSSTGRIEESPCCPAALLELAIERVELEHEPAPGTVIEQRTGAGMEGLMEKDGRGLPFGDATGDERDDVPRRHGLRGGRRFGGRVDPEPAGFYQAASKAGQRPAIKLGLDSFGGQPAFSRRGFADDGANALFA